MKAILLTVLILFSVTSFSQEESVSPYKHTFKSIITSAKEERFNKYFTVTDSCSWELANLREEKLHSEKIQKKLVLMKDYHRNINEGNTFYHYTTSNEVKKMGETNSIDLFFDYIRSRSYGYWTFLMYVANDTQSSRGYGNILLKVSMKDTAVVFDEYSASRSIKNKVYKEITKMHPSLARCDEDTIYYVTLEDMGVDMIHYRFSQGGKHWHQIMNPRAIDQVSL